VVRHQGEGDEDLLKRAWTATLLVLVLTAYAIIAGADRASAEPVKCPSGQVWNPQAVTCVLTATPPQPEMRASGMPRQSGSQPSKDQPKKCVSSYSGKEVPCKDGDSWWSNARDCYVSLADPQPPKSDPDWEAPRFPAPSRCLRFRHCPDPQRRDWLTYASSPPVLQACSNACLDLPVWCPSRLAIDGSREPIRATAHRKGLCG
jgi:hypothetical protein